MKKLNAIALISAALVANLAFAQIAAKKPATSHTATAPAKANATRPASAAASGRTCLRSRAKDRQLTPADHMHTRANPLYSATDPGRRIRRPARNW